MKKLNHYVLAISVGLLVLILIEGVITFGTAFDFSNYNIFAWIVQILFVIFTVSISIKMADE